MKNKSIICFNKRNMMSSTKFEGKIKFFFCNISFNTVRLKTSEGKKNLIVPQKQIDDNSGAYANKTSIRHIHGAEMIVYQDKIYFSNHTTKNKFKLGDKDIENIAIGEDWNPIKFVNPILGSDLSTFKRYFSVDTRLNYFLNSPRYGTVEDYDLLYLANRAFIKAFSADKYIALESKEDKLTSNISKDFIYFENENSIYTPTEFDLHTLKSDLPREILENYALIDENSKLDKEEYLKMYKGVHDEITNILK